MYACVCILLGNLSCSLRLDWIVLNICCLLLNVTPYTRSTLDFCSHAGVMFFKCNNLTFSSANVGRFEGFKSHA